MTNLKNKANENINKTKRVFRNAERLTEAFALLALGGFTAYIVITNQMSIADIVKKILLVSSAVVFVRGSYELIKFLDRD